PPQHFGIGRRMFHLVRDCRQADHRRYTLNVISLYQQQNCSTSQIPKMEKKSPISKLEGEGEPNPTTSEDEAKAPLPALESTPSIRIPPVWMLGIASGLSTFGLTITIPLLVEISNQFNADYASVQFVISAYMLGL